MGLEEYGEPKGAYYTPALVARFDNEESALAAIGALHASGFTHRDIQVARHGDSVTLVVSEPTPGMLAAARQIMAIEGAEHIHPYGAGT